MMWLFFLGFLIGGLIGIMVMGMAVAAGNDSRARRKAGLDP